MGEMNNFTDVREITKTYAKGVSEIETKIIAAKSQKEIKHLCKQAADKVAECEIKLKELKLSPDDRRHFHLLRESVKKARQGYEKAAKGNTKKADALGLEADHLIQKYLNRMGG